VWFSGAALGLSALVTTFPLFFHYLTYVGATYVGWLAFMSFHQAFAEHLAPIHKIKLKKTSPFVQGFIVQITNPKALLFFTAVLPPFMDVTRPIMPQLAVFAAAVFAMDLIAMSGYGLGGAALKKRAEDSRFRRGFSLAVGLLLLTAATLIVVGS
jgi:threonine/homoserine/homoserine lactone efflux protein